MTPSMTIDLPRGVVFPIETVDVRLDPAIHPFFAENADAIAKNWIAEVEANPALFNGRIALLSEIAWRDGLLQGRAHEVDYATLLYWKRSRPHPSVEHIYAHAMPVSSDGALVAVRMAANTANAGLIYFAAGSFEPSDFSDGQADVAGNMAREVLEETGLSLDGHRCDPSYHALSLPNGTVIFRRYFFDRPAAEIAAEITHFTQSGGDPHQEIVGPVIIRSRDDVPENLASQMPGLIDWHFSQPSFVA